MEGPKRKTAKPPQIADVEYLLSFAPFALLSLRFAWLLRFVYYFPTPPLKNRGGLDSLHPGSVCTVYARARPWQPPPPRPRPYPQTLGSTRASRRQIPESRADLSSLARFPRRKERVFFQQSFLLLFLRSVLARRGLE